MNYELAKELKEAGFPLRTAYAVEGSYPARGFTQSGIDYFFPTLSELIEACGEHLVDIKRIHNEHGIIWRAQGNDTPSNAPDWGYSIGGTTPEIAVANLWLAINKKP